MTRRSASVATIGVAFMLCVAPNPAVATEGGGSARALGVDTVMAGVMPPPGALFNTFLAYYGADRTLDGSGRDRPGISNFKLDAAAAVFRLSYVWSGVKLWGADVETRAALGPVDVNIRFDVQTPLGLVHRESSANGLGDPLLAPVVLGWHGERYHQMAGLYFFIPIGNFDKNRIANISRGYYTIAPIYWFTWFPTDRIEVSGNLIYLVNSENRDTSYKSGHEVGLDFGTGYDVTDAWQLGVSGYVYRQVTDDKVNGQIVADGNRGQALGIGPFVRFHPSKNWSLTLKWQHEAEVENRVKGDRFLLQIMYRLS